MVAPTPFLSSAVLAPLALKLAGSENSSAAGCRSLPPGRRTAGVAISEPIAGARDGAGVTAKDGRLSG